jgi:hypothetical protein
MNELDNQELLKRPLVEELIPTSFDENTEEQTYSSTSETLAILTPDAETVLSIGSVAGLPETTVTVPINISDAEGLQSLQVGLSYDPEILTIVDPNEDTDENEAVRRAGISADWELEPTNPVANVNVIVDEETGEETGTVDISLINTGELPEADEDGNVPNGTILEIDFTVNEDAELDSVTNIDLQSAGVGVNDQEIVFGDDNLDDGDLTVAEGAGSTIDLFRFRNTTFDTGTYLFVGEEERDAILSDPGLNQTFELEGVQEDGTVNTAFTASLEPGEDLEPYYRLRSLAIPGTYLFAGQSEYDAIFAEDSDQRDQWVPEGLDSEDNDVPEFYLYSSSADRGTQFNRFQNIQNNTFLYAGPDETAAIENDFSEVFNNQGDAFESL